MEHNYDYEVQNHEVFGGDNPDDAEMDADLDMSAGRADEDGDDAETSNASNSKGLEDMKRRLKEIEEEAGALREMQAKVEKEMGGVQDSSSTSATQAEKEEVDSRSVYVGNVDYACSPEEVQQHFQSCGTVNRVTILTDKIGHPKGFAYVEFMDVDAIPNALLLNESELHGRQLKASYGECMSKEDVGRSEKSRVINSVYSCQQEQLLSGISAYPVTKNITELVSVKRTNVPGMKQFRGRRPNPFGFRGRRPFMPAAPVYGRVPRFRRPMRYRPY